jgi:hypothetical protein
VRQIPGSDQKVASATDSQCDRKSRTDFCSKGYSTVQSGRGRNLSHLVKISGHVKSLSTRNRGTSLGVVAGAAAVQQRQPHEARDVNRVQGEQSPRVWDRQRWRGSSSHRGESSAARASRRGPSSSRGSHLRPAASHLRPEDANPKKRGERERSWFGSR